MPRNGGSALPGDDAPISSSEASHLFACLAREPAIVLAVSGGPDSTALLWLAARWRKRLKKNGPKLVAVTIDHGLRAESRAEARAVKALARSLGVAHTTLRWMGQKPARGVPAVAREARYGLLAKAARRHGASHVLTGHTRDDQAETVLMRLARGSGVSGLAGMKAGVSVPAARDEFVVLFRPLLHVSKARLLATLAAAKIPHADDPTNRDANFTRARLRMSMPILAREGLTIERLALLADRVQRVEIALHEAVNDAQKKLAPWPWTRGKPIVIDADGYGGLPEEIALRLMGRAISWHATEGPVELGKLESLCAALDGAIHDRWLAPQRSVRFRRTLAGAVVTLARGRLAIEPAPPRRTSPRRP